MTDWEMMDKRPIIIGAAVGLAVIALVAIAVLYFSGFRNAQVDVAYSIEYVDAADGKAIEDPSAAIGRNQQPITAEASKIKGYTLVSGELLVDDQVVEQTDGTTPFESTLQADATQVVRFTYAKLTGYTVRYEDANGNQIADAKTVDELYSGDEVTEKAPAIDGYTLESDKRATLKLSSNEDENVIVFRYVSNQPEPEPEPEPAYEEPVYEEPVYQAPANTGGGNSGGGGNLDGNWG